MVVTPIREDSRVVGVLAAFAPTPHAFTITHIAVLKTMADQISVLLQKERRAREENPQAEAPRPAPPVIAAKPVIAAAPAPVVPPAVVIKPSSSAPRAAAPATAKVEPIKSMPVEVVPIAMPPKAEKRVDVTPRASFGTFDSVAGEDKKPGNRMMMIGVVAVLVIAAGGTFAFLKLQKSGSASQHAQEAANLTPAPPAAAPPAGSSSATNVPSSTSAPNVAASANTSSPVAARPAAEVDSRKASKIAADRTSIVADKPSPAEKPAAPVSTLASSGPSRIAQESSGQTTPEVAPSFSVGGGSQGAALTNLAHPVASSTPSAAAIEQSQLDPLQLMRTGPLNYPAIAKARNITGVVVVQVEVDKDGKVNSPKFISGPPIFKDAAFESVLQYKFKPARLNGQPISQVTQIRLVFK
jgi:TonB family protein